MKPKIDEMATCDIYIDTDFVELYNQISEMYQNEMFIFKFGYQ